MLKYILIVLSLMLHHLDAVETPEMLNAFAVTKQRARDKDPESQFLLYQYYLAGKFVRKNEIRALTWLKRSSRNGNLEATLELLQRYIRGEGFLKNEKKAFQMAQKLSDNKIPVGDYFVGDMTLKGIGTKKDPEKGFALIRKSAMNGFPQAARYLAWCYYSGEGITKSVELSLAWITLADRMVKDKDIQAFKNSLLRTMKPGQITYAQKHFQEIVEEFQNKHKDSIAEQSDQIKDYQEQQMQTLRDQKLALVSFVFVRQGIGKGPSKIDIHLDKLGKSEKIIDLLRIKSEFIKQETYNTVMAVGYGKYTSYVPKTEYQDHYVSYYIANMAFEAGDYSFVAKVKKRTHKFEKMKVRKGKVYILDHTWRHERGFSNTDFKSKYLDQQVMIHAKQSLKYLADKELVQRVKDYKEEDKISSGPHQLVFHLDMDYKEKTKAESYPVVVIEESSLIQSNHKDVKISGIPSLIKTKTFGSKFVKSYTHSYIDTVFKTDFAQLKDVKCFDLFLKGHVQLMGQKKSLGKSGQITIPKAFCVDKKTDFLNLADIHIKADRDGTNWKVRIQ